MNDNFEKRVRDAASAGWWTLLLAAGFFMLQWIIYLLVMYIQPAWVLTLWGPEVSWQEAQKLWFLGLACFKVSLGLMAVAVLWLTLWARQLRKRAGTS
jgi:hypothetical protein